MATERIRVGIVVAQLAPATKWGEESWLPVAVLPAPPELAAWTCLGGAGRHWFAGAAELALHRTDTATYRDNLASGDPRVWVMARPGAAHPIDIIAVTADPAEGEAFTEAGSDIVEAVAMPAELAARVADFVAAHHVERPFVKRRRDGVWEEEGE